MCKTAGMLCKISLRGSKSLLGRSVFISVVVRGISGVIWLYSRLQFTSSIGRGRLEVGAVGLVGCAKLDLDDSETLKMGCACNRTVSASDGCNKRNHQYRPTLSTCFRALHW
jgi:hypothetical protein